MWLSRLKVQHGETPVGAPAAAPAALPALALKAAPAVYEQNLQSYVYSLSSGHHSSHTYISCMCSAACRPIEEQLPEIIDVEEIDASEADERPIADRNRNSAVGGSTSYSQRIYRRVLLYMDKTVGRLEVLVPRCFAGR